MNSELRYYLSIFFRRLPLFLLVFLTITGAALFYALSLPTVYTARGLLLVEAPQIPTNLAASTVQVSSREQLAVIQRRLMTRSNLLEIAREFDVYEDIREMSPDEIVQSMREDTRIAGSGRGSAATVMEVQFRARSGRVAAEVSNDYITRILAENATNRQQRAEGTLDFFEEQVRRLERQLDAQNDVILEFQNQNAEALPDTLNYRLSRQELLTQRMSQIDRDRSVLATQLARLEELQAQGFAGLPEDDEDRPATALDQQLAQLRNQLTNARAIYAPDSPRVTVLAARIEALEVLQQEEIERALAEAEGASDTLEPLSADPTLDGTPMTPVQIQIEQVGTQIRFLDEQTATIDAELAELEQTIERTPANSIELQALRRGYENMERQYNQALDRLYTASTGERIEVMSKGERISVIEQARAPDEPSDPNRPMIAAVGTMGAAGAAIGLVLLLELLNKTIRRPVDLTNGLGITPLTTVSYIVTPGQRLRKRLLWTLVILFVATAIPAGLYYVHYEIRPLDLLWDRLVARFTM
ncbi:MAG: lipopolysaccharide biosynthesis protein [Pseudomonadota bacterium]